MSIKRHWKRLIIGFGFTLIVNFVMLMLTQNARNSASITEKIESISPPFVCSSVNKGKIDLDSNVNRHKDKLSLIVGNEAFTKPFAMYCENILHMEVIQKSLKIASSFWVMDNDKYENHPNYEFNEIHAPFFTNKEYKYKFNIHYFDYVYLFVNKYDINLQNTFKLIAYANTVNVTCFVLITNIISNEENDSIQQIQSHLTSYHVNYITFQLHNVYIANDTKFIHNHHIALLFHQIMQNKAKNIKHLYKIFKPLQSLDILYFQDVIKYIAVSPLYQHLYYKTFHIKSIQNNFPFNFVTKQILNILNVNIELEIDEFLSLNVNPLTDEWFDCYFLSQNEKLIETSIDNILNIIYMDLSQDVDLISRKKTAHRFDKSAVFCDNRFDEGMVKVVLNYMINLDQTWQFELFVGEQTMKLWKGNQYLTPYVKTEKIVLKDFSKYYVNAPVEFFQNISFWQSIKYEKILLFQADSVLCSASNYRIEDFLQYDYVGGPWRNYGDPTYEGRVGNGGLSLRSKSVMIKLLTLYPPIKQKKKHKTLSEDYFVTRYIGLLSGVHLPPYSIAKRFATESDYWKLSGHEISAGIHRHYMKQRQTFTHFVDICAEFNITYKRIRYWDRETGWG